MKKIILTGGGTAGHVMPCLALVPELRAQGFIIEYIGSKTGMEKGLIEKEGIPYHGISSGKLRRYFALKNLTDPFRVIKGVNDALKVLKKVKPDIIFSKGGFVAVPVCLAGKMLKIPVVIHESDLSVGLANRICTPFADTICVSFPETMEKMPKGKTVLTGTPVRAEILNGSREKGLSLCGFDGKKPVLLVMGGSLGSARINSAIRQWLATVSYPGFSVAHICGRGNVDGSLKTPDYCQFEFVTEELPHLYAAADILVSRAGAGAIAEILALKKPALLIPLSKNASRGDQVLNAKSFASRGFGGVLYEDELSGTFAVQVLATRIHRLYDNAQAYIKKMGEDTQAGGGVSDVMRVIGRKTSAALDGF